MSMQPRRRQILRIVGTACLASGTNFAFGADPSRGTSVERGKEPVRAIGEQWVASVSAESAKEFVGSSFEFWSVHGRAAAVLSEIIETSKVVERRGGWASEAFQLAFVVTESTRNLPRDLCNVAHPQLGSFELFIQNSKNAKGHEQFVATFCRLSKNT